ncbi:methyltransferase domain-containing protein [Nostoc sp. CHAB 5824]|nr:methyltransferase domain-containing protein [Nostoc sp. CHAB 5824]
MEENNPEINVDELMHKIREDVIKRQVYSQKISSESNLDASKLKSSISYIETLLQNAEFRSFARIKWPDKLNRFPFNCSAKLQKLILKVFNILFKDQREVNLNIINFLKGSVSLNHQLIEQIITLKVQLDERMDALDSRFQGINDRLVALDTCIQKLDEKKVILDDRFQGLNERVIALDSCFQKLDERQATSNSRFQGLDERLVSLDRTIQRIGDSFNTIDTLVNSWLADTQEDFDGRDDQVQVIKEHLANVDIHIQRINEHLVTTNTQIQKIDELHIKNDNYIKNDLMQQKRLLSLFLEEVRQRLPEPFSQEQLQIFMKEDKHLLDAFYFAFEDQFRGDREQIINRLKVYLPLVKEAKVTNPGLTILDVGCGRGEWLELLRESGYAAKGIDINRVMLEHCRNRGFEVIDSDVIAYLQSLPDASLSVVTGFHIIEHLPFKILIKLVDETIRVLNSGGLAIFESPNPENLVVGACNFYSDPTHLNPLFPPTIKFVLEQRGFSNVELMRLSEHRLKDPLQLIKSDNPIASQLNPLIEIVKYNFYASPDFAVIAKKY